MLKIIPKIEAEPARFTIREIPPGSVFRHIDARDLYYKLPSDGGNRYHAVNLRNQHMCFHEDRTVQLDRPIFEIVQASLVIE